MHPKFEQRLENLNELAREDVSTEQEGKGREDLDTEIIGTVQGYARRSGTAVRAEMEIYQMQFLKQECMQKLYQELEGIDKPEMAAEIEPGSLPVLFEGGRYLVAVNELECELSEGEVLTAEKRGYRLYLDPQTVPRSVRKRHLVENAKREIRNHLDEQIYLDELNSNRNRTYVTEAYNNLLGEREDHIERKGKIAEQVIATFFERLQYDTNLDFTLEPADIYQDVLQKVDFIVRKRHHERGVRIEEADMPETTGIQFTINDTPEVLAKKQNQVDRAKAHLQYDDEIQDILLVSLPSEVSFEVWEAYQEWKKAGLPVAVDRYLSEDIKEKLFRNILQGIYSEEEINAQWELVNGAESLNTQGA